MIKIILSIFCIILFISCVDRRAIIIIKNDTKIKIGLFYSEIDDTLSNKWIFEYSKIKNISRGIVYNNIKEEIKPNSEVKVIPNLKYLFKITSKYKLRVFILNYDSLLNVSKYQRADSSMINKVLIGTITIDKVFYMNYLSKAEERIMISEFINIK
jgi:hypothetical protein